MARRPYRWWIAGVLAAACLVVLVLALREDDAFARTQLDVAALPEPDGAMGEFQRELREAGEADDGDGPREFTIVAGASADTGEAVLLFTTAAGECGIAHIGTGEHAEGHARMSVHPPGGASVPPAQPGDTAHGLPGAPWSRAWMAVPDETPSRMHFAVSCAEHAMIADWYPQDAAAEVTPVGDGFAQPMPDGRWVLAVAEEPLLAEITDALRR